MKVIVGGASGLIGKELTKALESEGHQVVPLLRHKKDPAAAYWNPDLGEIDLSHLEGADAIVNLAGENIVGRWNPEKKEKVRSSRVESTKLIAKSLEKLERPPKVWINASAIGYYGNVTDREVTETSPAGEGFLADVCREWEEATHFGLRTDTRIIHLRIGVVLTPKGGALQRMLLPFKLCLGGVLGSGEQEMSWIDIEDLTRAIVHCIETPTLRGPVNATAPHPVTNRTFTKTLAKVLRRPAIFPVPASLLRVLFGEMAESILLGGAEVIPEKLLQSGFTFRYPDLKSSLIHLIKS